MGFLAEPTLLIAAIEILVGLFLLAKAADLFVDGAVNVARGLKISPVVIGAVIVGFGTSAPELLVSGIAASNGDLDLGVGNVVGSNVANLTLVLGAAALLVPLLVTKGVLSREAPLSLFAVCLFGFFTRNGLTRLEGAILLVALVVTLWLIISSGRVEIEDDGAEPRLGKDLLMTLGGLVGTVIGAQLLVWGATAVAEEFGLGGGFVGFTLVAMGTSLPELVTAVAAARKGATDLILGNLLGSNIFNSLAVGSAISLIGPGQISDDGLRVVGVICMIVVAVVAWLFMVTRKRVHKVEAIVLLAVWLVSVVLMAGDSVDETAIAMMRSLTGDFF